MANAPGGLPPTVTGTGLVVAPRGSRALTTAFSRYLVQCHEGFAALPSRLPALLAAATQPVIAHMQKLAALDARNTLLLYASPTIGTPLQCVALRDALPAFTTRIDAAAAAIAPHLLLELCARDRLEAGDTFDWPAAPSLASLSLGIAIDPPDDATSLRFTRGRVAALRGDAVVASLTLANRAVEGFRIRTPYTRVRNVTRFATIDHNPIAAFEAHPDKHGNHVDLGGRPLAEWTTTLSDAMAVIEAALPETFAEMQWLLHEIVPVGYDLQKHLSASYREAIGTVYLTLHPNVMTMAEAIVHEFQHNKLNLAAYGAEFIVNAFEPLYRSPVRPDPRPLWGILLAVHAFLPVAVMYRRMRAAGHPHASSADFARRLAEIDLKNHEGMEMLRANAEWTAQGTVLMAELDALDRAHMDERAASGLSTAPTDAHVG